MALREPSGGIPADHKWITKVKEEGPPQMGQHLMGVGGYPGGWKRVGSASYREDLKQAELSGVTLLLSSINQHGHGDVFHVLRKQYNEEDGPGTETNKTTPGLASWGSS